MCGHGTLAVAAALFSKAVGNPHPSLTFNTLSGPLTAINRTKEGGHVELNFPMNRPVVVRPGKSARALVAKRRLRHAAQGRPTRRDRYSPEKCGRQQVIASTPQYCRHDQSQPCRNSDARH